MRRFVLASICALMVGTPALAQKVGRAGTPGSGGRQYGAAQIAPQSRPSAIMSNSYPQRQVPQRPQSGYGSGHGYDSHGHYAPNFGPRGYGHGYGYGRGDYFGGLGVTVGGVGSFNYYHGPVGGPPISWPVYGNPYGYGDPRGPVAAPYGYAPYGGGWGGYQYPDPVPEPVPPQANGWADQTPDSRPIAQPSPLLLTNPSSAAAKLKSVRAQSDGDMWFRQQEFHKAYDRYKAAINAAGDLAKPRYRLAMTFIALGHFDPAVREIKRAIQLEPDFPETAEPLEELFGVENRLAKSSMVTRVASWVQEDLRNADRLFLMGAVLHFDGDTERARPFFEAAMKLEGQSQPVVAFLDAAAGPSPSIPQATEPALPEPIEPVRPVRTKPADDELVPPLPVPAAAESVRSADPTSPAAPARRTVPVADEGEQEAGPNLPLPMP